MIGYWSKLRVLCSRYLGTGSGVGGGGHGYLSSSLECQTKVAWIVSLGTRKSVILVVVIT